VAPNLPPIYAITDRAVSGVDSHVSIARRLLSVGVRCVQVREKAMPDRVLLREVEEAAALCRQAGAFVLVNDRVDIARVAGTGVHVGEDDLPAREARRLLPENATVGVSTHDLEAARRAFADPSCDYVAFGPVFESGTKVLREPRGLASLKAAAALKTKPLVAIGGITAELLDGVFDAGADSAAMIGGLLSGGSMESNARRALDAARRRRVAPRIFLVGFMGCGKTTVGRLVAERLGLPFVDLDTEIERISGLTVRAFFEASGEEAFRQREALFLSGTETLEAAVVATGGGSFIPEGNREVIKRLGAVVFLDVPFPAVARRLAGKTDRPLFKDPEAAARLFVERAPFYRMGSIPVSLTGDETVEEAADRVLIALDQRLP
jgi:thiamine-phosphate diphosphorylase